MTVCCRWLQWWRPASATGGRRKSCRGERNAGRGRGKESRWLLGGRLVVEAVRG